MRSMNAYVESRYLSQVDESIYNHIYNPIGHWPWLHEEELSRNSSGAFHLIIPGGLHVRCVEKTREGKRRWGGGGMMMVISDEDRISKLQ
jgi:hypothetical protein